MTTLTRDTALHVRLDAGPVSARTRAALAALPEHYEVLAPAGAVGPDGPDGAGADVLVVSGENGWPQRLSDGVEAGPRAVLLECPEPVTPLEIEQVERVAALAAERGVVVAVDTRYAANALWRTVLPPITDDLAGFGVLDAVATVDTSAEVATAMLALLGAVRPLLSGDRLAASPVGSPGCLTSFGLGATAVTVAAVTGAGLTALELALVGPHRRWTVCLPADGTARPAEAAVHDRDGAQAFRPVFESASRATWRELHDELSGREGSFHRLTDLVADLQLYATLLP